MPNIKIKEAAKKAGIPLWKVAEEIGTCDSGFSRMLRHELPEEKQARVFDAIAKLAAEEVAEDE